MVGNDVVRQELGLAVDVLHQVMVHHGNHALAALLRKGELLLYPCQGLGLDSAVGVIAHLGVATVGIDVAVDAQQHQPWNWFAGVAQRVRVAVRVVAVTKVVIDVCKLLASYA